MFEPPASAQINNLVAFGYMSRPIVSHQRRNAEDPTGVRPQLQDPTVEDGVVSTRDRDRDQAHLLSLPTRNLKWNKD